LATVHYKLYLQFYEFFFFFVSLHAAAQFVLFRWVTCSVSDYCIVMGLETDVPAVSLNLPGVRGPVEERSVSIFIV